MNRLVLFAIPIDDVRDIFGADDALAERLRAVAGARFAPERPRRRGWFAPLLARDRATEVDPRLPNRQDADALLAGGFIAPERMEQCRQLLSLWVEELCSAHRWVPWDAASFERIEWDLARAGLNSDHSLRRLAERKIGSPLRPYEGQVVGYAKHVQAVQTLDGLRAAAASGDLSPETAEFIVPVIELLDVVADNDALDVVVIGER